MRRFLHEMGRMLRTNRSSIFLFEVIYKLFMVFVLTETLSRSVSFALKKTGYSYLTARNALRFFCSPITLLSLAGFVMLCLFLAGLEMCVLYTAFQAGVAGERMSPINMLVFGFRNLIELFRSKNVRVFLVNANFYLLTAGWTILGVLKHIRPLNYIISELAGVGIVKVIFWVILTAMVLAAVAYMYVPSVSILRDISFKESCEKSREIFRRHWLTTVVSLGAANFGAWLFYYVLQLVLKVTAAILVVLFADKSTELALILTISNGIDVFSFVLAAMAVLFLNLGILTFLLYRYQDKKYRWEIPPYHDLFPAGIRKFVAVLVVTSLAVMGGIYVYDSIYTGTVKTSMAMSEAKITCHRGNSSEAPENTIPAIEAAVENMSDFVEIDVQETRDGIVVVYHDASLKRIVGEPGKLWEYTYGDLLMMDFGSWFSEEFRNVKIPTLEEAMEVCKGRISINIELKANRISDTLVDKVLELIDRYDMKAQVVISSTSYRYLKEVREKNPDIRTGYILTAAYGNYFEDDNIDFFSIRSSFVTAGLVKSAHDCGKEIHVWTVNSKAELSRMKKLQVDNIITDMPVLAREILYREAGTETIFDFLRLALRS